MRVFYMGNNWLGATIARWLAGREDATVVGCALHPEANRSHGEAILEAFSLPDEAVLDAGSLDQNTSRDVVEALNPELGLSVLFDYILSGAFIDLFPEGIVNLHPSYLPYNRGQYPNVWSIVEETPAGVSLHRVDTGIDTGDILARRRVEVEPIDTGRTLYRKLEMAAYRLFCDRWQELTDGSLDPVPQDPGEGTYHRQDDVERIDGIDLDATYTARDLINILRARTFPPYDGAYFETDDGRTVQLRLDLSYGDPES